MSSCTVWTYLFNHPVLKPVVHGSDDAYKVLLHVIRLANPEQLSHGLL